MVGVFRGISLAGWTSSPRVFTWPSLGVCLCPNLLFL